jgi:hypothetical protein
MDIFDFLKENEHELYERPPEQTWKRLEQQLRVRRQRRRSIRFLQLSIAALTLFLLLLAGFLVWYYTKHGGK